ncbi:MAG: DUF916 domain-containing protein [Candidatus Gracilibacteria bacterium]
MSLLLVATFFMGNQTALAGSQVTLTVKNPDPVQGNHSWFIYEQEAGQTIEDVATLKNFSDEPANVNLYAVDATSSETGSFILKFREEEQKGIGYWSDVETKSVTIEPQQSVDIPFKIILPEGVPPGQYLGGLIAETGSPQEVDAEEHETCVEQNLCGTNISVRTRIGTRIYLTVPGKTYEDYNLTDFSAVKSITGTTKFEFRIENNGNVAYEPIALINVYDGMGNLYEQIEKKLGTSSPGTVIHPVVKMKNRPLIGNFSAKAVVTFERKFGSSEFHSASPTEELSLEFWVMPWEIIFIVLLLLVAAAGIMLQRKRVWEKYMQNAEAYVVQEGEDIGDIAKKHHINWKRLAKFNKLKPPYLIDKDQTLMVPKQKNEQ